ncbi:MAG TPA: ABC transporter ATP-binding protein, partial [Acidimicrobiales bacterium]|nr:ABC transporter ATP-binding protein [Acidimicrobiales bacterium]
LWLGGAAVVGHRITVGTLAAIISYVLLLGTPVRTFGFMVTWFTRGLSGGTRVFEVLDTEPAIADPPDARPLTHVRGHVRFENVSFAYGEGPDVLRGVDIDAPPGEVVALLGATGSGKSTILHLLPRFYDVTGGRITIDGVDVRDATLDSIHQVVGVVTQDAHLFHETIRDNLLYAKPDASEDELLESLRAAQILPLVRSLPDGLDTVVGDRGYRLSGGEKQRIAIARLLLKAPDVVVLDEATAHLDSESEQAVQEALRTALEGRTSLVIAHRLSTVREADQILVVDGGRIVERGTHTELLREDGLYAELYRTQFATQDGDGGAGGNGRALSAETAAAEREASVHRAVSTAAGDER